MNKIKAFFKKRRNGGFTMVEMIVSIALLAVLLGGMMMVITPILRSFSDTKTDLVAESVSTCIQTYMINSIKDSTNVVVFANTDLNGIKNSADAQVSLQKLMDCSAIKTVGGTKNAYKLKCISLKYDETTERYYLYSETCAATAATPIDETIDSATGETGRRVFADCLYDGLYFSLDFRKATYLDPTITDELEAVAEFTLSTYSDPALSNLVFGGIGLTEFRVISDDMAQVKAGLKSASGASIFEIYATDSSGSMIKCDATNGYGFQTHPDDYEHGTDTVKDVYIFYTTYNYDNS